MAEGKHDPGCNVWTQKGPVDPVYGLCTCSMRETVARGHAKFEKIFAQAKAEIKAEEQAAAIDQLKAALESSQPMEFLSIADHLAALSPGDYDQWRGKVADRLNYRKPTLDAMVDERRRVQKAINGERPEVKTIIDSFNRQYFKIRNYGAHARVGEMRRQRIGDLEVESLVTRSHYEFEMAYRDRQILVGSEMRTHGALWLDSPDAITYDSVEYAPNQTLAPGIFNLWRGFAFEPKKGDCSLYLAHIRDNICRHDVNNYKIVLSWMAAAVRHPERHANWALAIKGKKGVGKNMFAEPFIRLFGPHGIILAGEHAVTSHFNSALHNKSAALFDEALFAGDPSQDRVIKGLITGTTLRIEAKGIDAFTVPNMLHAIIIGNDDRLVHATSDERRYFALECGEECRKNDLYFKAINKQLTNGGYEALLHFLLNEAFVFDINDAPQTETLKDQMTGNAVDELWIELLSIGSLPGRVNPNGTVDVKLERILEWAHKQRRRGWSEIRHCDLTRLLGKNELDLTKSGTIYIDKQKVRCWHIPTLAECRENWDRKKYRREWPEDDGAWDSEVGF